MENKPPTLEFIQRRASHHLGRRATVLAVVCEESLNYEGSCPIAVVLRSIHPYLQKQIAYLVARAARRAAFLSSISLPCGGPT